MIDSEWGEFQLSELYGAATRGKRLKSADRIPGNLPFVTAGETEAGISGYIGNDVQIFDANTVTIDMFGSAKYRNYQYGADDHVAVVHTESIPPQAVVFLATAIHKSAYTGEFSYSRNFYPKDADCLVVNLPIKDGQPDYELMSSIIEELESERLDEMDSYLDRVGLRECELTYEEEEVLASFEEFQWEEFEVGSLFKKISTNKLPFKAKELPRHPSGSNVLPCLTASFMNQGLNYFAPKEGATVLKNVVSLPSNSDVYRAYYQSREFTVLSDSYAIEWQGEESLPRPETYLFLVACINRVTDLPLFSYKQKLGGWNVVKGKKIALPVQNGGIDLARMDLLISALQKIAMRNVVGYVDRKTRRK